MLKIQQCVETDMAQIILGSLKIYPVTLRSLINGKTCNILHRRWI